jgi:hypothetical protein
VLTRAGAGTLPPLPTVPHTSPPTVLALTPCGRGQDRTLALSAAVKEAADAAVREGAARAESLELLVSTQEQVRARGGGGGRAGPF